MSGEKLIDIPEPEVIEQPEELDSYGLDEDDDPRAIKAYLEGQKENEDSLYPKTPEPVSKMIGRVAIKTKPRERRNYID